MASRRKVTLAIVAILAASVLAWLGWGRLVSLKRKTLHARRTVAQVAAEIGPAAVPRLKSAFQERGAVWPPQRVALLAFKEERRLELWAARSDRFAHARDYAILAASGRPGPKLREGDRQVPEGTYRIVSLNPNSRFHLSMELNYPNESDVARAKRDGRTNLGGEIFIHGGDVSIGCLAIGDRAIEELFFLVDAVGRDNVKVVIAPNDMRRNKRVPRDPADPPWVNELYDDLCKELAAFGL